MKDISKESFTGIDFYLFIFNGLILFYFSALDKIIVQGYKSLRLQYFFTAGPDEVKAWTIQVQHIIFMLPFYYF